MQTIIWAFGSMLILMLIIAFLPLGFTLKGKFFVVLTGFVLALGGLAATTSFPIWAILLMLLVLAFFAAYMMDSRIAAMVYEEKDIVEEVMFEDIELPFASKQKENTPEIDSLELSELEIVVPALTKTAGNLKPEASTTSTEENDNALGLDEDISFLQERDSEIEAEPEIDDAEVEVSYLSDIESMLLEDSVESQEMEEGCLDELADMKEINEKEKVDIDDNQIDESELELLFDTKEVAAGREDNLEENNSKRVVELQK
ncbi:UbiA family prenyltransferase [Neobacillus sp. FSL H8-0543]|uniref:UbiA family prenyltransferase n=1 Tax=Neobacillus sp. FSL H8-0543 TaxID=2954672 RepID=UPI003159145D